MERAPMFFEEPTYTNPYQVFAFCQRKYRIIFRVHEQGSHVPLRCYLHEIPRMLNTHERPYG